MGSFCNSFILKSNQSLAVIRLLVWVSSHPAGLVVTYGVDGRRSLVNWRLWSLMLLLQIHEMLLLLLLLLILLLLLG